VKEDQRTSSALNIAVIDQQDLLATPLLTVSTSEIDICTLPAERGICVGDIKRYFYNSDTKTCELFQYGGCLGNENNFFTLHDCEQACSGEYLNLLICHQ